MTTNYDERLSLQRGSLQSIGLLKKGKPVTDPRPLIVFIHGIGSNASYFDNKVYSYPQKLSQLGHYVLNIQRPAYGGTPMPSSTKPLFDSIPLVTELIDQAYWDHAGGKGGVILVGHSVGAALAVAIAAQSDSQLPVIGLSLVGLVPTPSRSQLIPDPDPDPENPRLSPESMSAMASDFMGPMKYLNREIFSDGATLKKIFEPLSRAELREYPGPEWYAMLVETFMPAIKIPVQYLATEYEGIWTGIAEGQPIFDNLAKCFVNSPDVEAKLLAEGSHNYDLSWKADELHHMRMNFIARVTRSSKTYSESE